MAIKIITDSSCDIATETLEKYNISTIPLFINIGEQSFQDGVNFDREQFYVNLPNYQDFPKTAAPSPETFTQKYQEAADEGYSAVFSIHVSGKLSGTINSAYIAAKEFDALPIYVIDSQNLSAGAGYVVTAAAKSAAHGASVEEVKKTIDDIIPRTYTVAVIESLEHLQHSGRMGKFVMALGSALSIRLILKMNRGHPGAEQFRTLNKIYQRLEDLAEKLGPFESFAFLHTNNPSRVKKIQEEIEDRCCLDIEPEVLKVNPVLGSHLGPSATGFSCVTIDYPTPSIFEKSMKSLKKAAKKIRLPNPSSLWGEKEEDQQNNDSE